MEIGRGWVEFKRNSSREEFPKMGPGYVPRIHINLLKYSVPLRSGGLNQNKLAAESENIPLSGSQQRWRFLVQ